MKREREGEERAGEKIAKIDNGDNSSRSNESLAESSFPQGSEENEQRIVIYHDPLVEMGMKGFMRNDIITQILLDTSEEGNKLRYEHMYGLWKLVCQVYGYDNLSHSMKTAFTYAILNCNKHPIIMHSFLFMAIHLEHSLAEYLAPPEPGSHHPPEWREKYKNVMQQMTEDLKNYEDGCIRPAATTARLQLPDPICPKVPPAKLGKFKHEILQSLETQYSSGEGGCKLRSFTESCIWSWVGMGVSWRAHERFNRPIEKGGERM